jgi:hypothetical protein
MRIYVNTRTIAGLLELATYYTGKMADGKSYIIAVALAPLALGLGSLIVIVGADE